MTHLPYILSSYGLTAIAALWLSIALRLRLKRARARLAGLERAARAQERRSP
ncbi:heme exporter protein CcmD [Swaminathania salitolerans]|uniref:Heme exporter protein D n=1 Tax=Swaminathania salitolerans TaxID=182838 RepID=A0A511BMM6_9PROT|nr:heme exporter protein CcmD [Swaminathania salitolerans]GBQ10528.1 hypothetical protein AA21291_0463 [Swaminathania salitolerans LMG 21291]GEL01322.1 hypothetical protein SSA02_04850 [Swaminathania salitolerans]